MAWDNKKCQPCQMLVNVTHLPAVREVYDKQRSEGAGPSNRVCVRGSVHPGDIAYHVDNSQLKIQRVR